ncbi:MAG TPA: hypothetical protein VM223_02430 [Planctomycetota bacterium]|nr:hypothetical protein [Planctomycetota bacterium]
MRALEVRSRFPKGPNLSQARFMACAAHQQLFMGPPACGKSQGVLEKLQWAAAAYPNNEVVIGQRVRLDLVQNTIPHFWRIAVPELYSNWCSREKFANKHDMVLYLHNGSYIRFTGLADSGDFGSANLGAIGLMECYHPLGGKSISKEVYFAGDKALRNPNAAFRFLAIDSNRIPRNHWLYKEFGENGKPGHEVFFPTWDENRPNLPRGFVAALEANWTEGQRAAMMQPGWGEVISGHPVYGETFMPGLHINEALSERTGKDEDEWVAVVDRAEPVYVCWDTGYVQPWVTWHQVIGGQWRCLGELLPSFKLLDALIPMVLAYTEKHFPYCAVRHCTGYDVVHHKDTGVATSTFAQYGISPICRPTRSVRDEVEQIIRYMSRLVPGQGAAFQISTRCPATIEVLRHGYRWAENREGRVGEIPQKDGFFEHGADSVRHFAINVLGLSPQDHRRFTFPESYASYGSKRTHSSFRSGRQQTPRYGVRANG